MGLGVKECPTFFSLLHLNPRAQCLILIPTTSSSADLGVLVPGERMLPLEETAVDPIKWTVRLSSGHFGLLTLLNQQTKKWITVFAGVTDLSYQGDIGLLLCCIVRQEGHV